MKKGKNTIFDGMYGLAVADALGVPYETASLEVMKRNPCTEMVGGGFHQQPAGSWSDDTSMALCVADSLSKGFDPEDMMKKFWNWVRYKQYTAANVVFDVGGTCRQAINRFRSGIPLEYCGNRKENGNGNGALMRTFPIALYQCFRFHENPCDLAEFLEPIHQASRITHAHEIGLICCGMFSLTLKEWLEREENEDFTEIAVRAYEIGLKTYEQMGREFAEQLHLFTSPKEIKNRTAEELPSWGYALNTWNIALWSLLTTDNYKDCVLKAINVGGDTDTNGVVAGALAGVIYGKDSIPEDWLATLRNKPLIDEICEDFNRYHFKDIF